MHKLSCMFYVQHVHIIHNAVARVPAEVYSLAPP